MNEHAKKIWQAWLDGKLVEMKTSSGLSEHELWVTAHPYLEEERFQPQNDPNNWRIKPIKWYRVYLIMDIDKDRNDNWADIATASTYSCEWMQRDREVLEEEIEKCKHFGGWLTDWVEYEN